MSDQEKTLRQNLKSSDATVRKEALESLLTVDLDDELIEMVAQLFSDPDKGVRDAASMLFTFQPYPGVPSHIVKYVFSEDISIRNMAGEVLLKNGSNSVDTLISELGKGNYDDEKFIIDILGWIGDPKPTQKIIEILKTNKNENVVLACAEALGNIKAEEAVGDLVALLENDEDEILTPTVMEALGKIGNKEAIDHFMKVYGDQDVLTKFTIIESLGRVGDEESLGFLLNELQTADDALIGSIVKSSEHLLTSMGFEIEFDDSLKAVILKALDESDDSIVLSAVKLLSNYDNPEIIEAFVSIYGENDELDYMFKEKFINSHNVACPIILNKINSEAENIKKLLLLYKDLNEYGSDNGFEPLSDTQNMELLNTLSTYVDSHDEEIRMTSAELLFKINPKDALLFTDKLMEDDNVWNRLKLVELLGEVNDAEVIEVLEKLTNDPDEMVRERALSLLEEKQTRN
jgi:HEAT repeat protein